MTKNVEDMLTLTHSTNTNVATRKGHFTWWRTSNNNIVGHFQQTINLHLKLKSNSSDLDINASVNSQEQCARNERLQNEISHRNKTAA